MPLTPTQYERLIRPLNTTRIAKRSQGGKQLSYLEAWDVRAHLIRMFGYGNFDIETLEYRHVATREYVNGDRDMIEVVYSARVRLTCFEQQQNGFASRYPLCTYVECAVGSASGPANMLGDHHDNALKTAVSDAMKRCAMNLGNQFGLSLYDDGSTKDVVRGTIVKPPGVAEEEAPPTDEEARQAVEQSLGGTEVTEGATNA